MFSASTASILNALRTVPAFRDMLLQTRHDIEAERATLAQEAQPLIATAEKDVHRLELAFNAAMAKRDVAQEAFRLESTAVQLAQAAMFEAHAIARVRAENIRQRLTESADPCIALAIAKVDEILSHEHTAPAVSARTELVTLLTTTRIDAPARVAEIIGGLGLAHE